MTVDTLVREPLPFDDDGPVCRTCGCDDYHACYPPCWWVADDLCSNCEGV